MHILKIDRAFIRNLAQDQRDRELAKAMIAVAAALHLEGVVAEGVETQEQADLLSELGCTLVQGYLYGRPVPPAEATEAARAAMATGPVGSLPGQRPPMAAANAATA